MRNALIILSVFCVLSMAVPAGAQDADTGDMAARLELAKRMNSIRPARMQVEEAVAQVTANLPAAEADKVKQMVEKHFDFERLQEMSIKSMAETFTVPELEKMVSYFESDEAKAIEKKLPAYQAKVNPEIVRMLDAAIINERTGGPGDKVDTKIEDKGPPPAEAPAP